jgi:4-amino-4-deoxy-L-arabinose transferase-like glycosyltransferase
MSKRASSLLWLALALVWLASLGLRPLYKPDEGRYAEIPREMVASGDWVTPRLNGFKYFEKPPLQYWVTAAAFKLLGFSDWTARLWVGLAGLAGIALTFAAANRLFGPPAGLIAAAILVSSPLYVLLGQINTLDMGVTFFLSAAVFAFALAQRDAVESRERLRWMLLFWAACACAVLSKGLIGIVLPLGAIGVYVLWSGQWSILRRLALLPGIAVFLLIAAPWFIAVSAANDEFLRFFFIQEHWLRFTTKLHKREEPVWFFAAVLAGGLLPWLLPACAAWARALRSPRGALFSPRLFLGLWALLVFVFFSVSNSKLIPYILPVVPALAVLAGDYLAARRSRGLLGAQAALVVAAGFAMGGVAWWFAGPGRTSFYGLGGAYVPWVAGAAVLAVGGGVLAGALAWRERAGAAMTVLALAVFPALLALLAGLRPLGPAYSASPLVEALPRLPASGARIFAVESYDHTVPWYLRRTVTLVVYKDELAQPIGWEPHKFVPDLAAFASAWSGERDAYALFAVKDFDKLRGELALPMEVVLRSPRYVLVRKP